MKRRRPTPDELDLWNRVAASAQRMHPGPVPTPPKPPTNPTPERKAKPRVMPPAPAPKVIAAPRGPVMDAKSHARMTRGKMKPEARIDLHGMTLDQAHPALVRFILSSHDRGKRLVLVITGKGKQSEDTGPIPRVRGILRRQVPHWLTTPPLAQAVLDFTPAHIRHGGEGAFYVYLRRLR